MQLIRQREPADCLLCTVAMFADKSYEETFNKARELKLPTTKLCDDYAIKILAAFDIKAKRSINFYSQFPAIITVPSLNYPGVLHSICWDGKFVFDPQEGTGKQFYTKEFMFEKSSYASTIFQPDLISTTCEVD